MRAQNIANIRLWRLAIIYLCLWLAPGITLLLFHLLAAPDYIAGTTRVFGALANLFGPWTTIVTTLSDWPNAGARFSLSNAILTTAAIAVVVTTSMAVKRKWVQICCIVVFIPLIFLWLFFGMVQLMHCAL